MGVFPTDFTDEDMENWDAMGQHIADLVEKDEPRCYKVVRFYFNKPGYKRTIMDRVTLSVAQLHCNDPETSSSTCTNKAGKARTRRYGPWFDGYQIR